VDASNLGGAIIFGIILMVSVPVLFVVGLMREVKDNSPRKGLRNPKIAIPIGVFLLYLSGIILDPFTFFSDPSSLLIWNPFFIIGFGFTWIGVVALYKEHKNGLYRKY